MVLNATELLGKAKALLPIWNRKVETSREMDYGEIKASIGCLTSIEVLRSDNNV